MKIELDDGVVGFFSISASHVPYIDRFPHRRRSHITAVDGWAVSNRWPADNVSRLEDISS